MCLVTRRCLPDRVRCPSTASGCNRSRMSVKVLVVPSILQAFSARCVAWWSWLMLSMAVALVL